MSKTTEASYLANRLAPEVSDYVSLMKPRVMFLVVFTALCGLLLAPGNIHPVIAITAIICITTGSGSAASINMWYDRDIDAVMKRTQRRPIVRGVIDPDEALSFGIVTGILSVLMMALCVNILSAGLLALTILYYIFVYTIWLKRRSMQNVVIGGVAGALPPMIGWAAVTGDISLESLTLFMIIFTWTPPHSWALALFRVDDYQNCNIPMMPVVKGSNYTKIQIVFYTILLLISSVLPYFLGFGNLLYLIISSLLGVMFLYRVFLLFGQDEQIMAKKLFFFSIYYLFLVFLLLIMPIIWAKISFLA